MSIEMLECQACHKKMTAITTGHLRSKKCAGVFANREEYLIAYPGAKMMTDTRKASCAVTEEKMIIKWGEEEGKKRYAVYCKKLSDKNTFEFFQQRKGWTREQYETYNKSRGVTLENLTKKYGIEKGTEVFTNYCEKQRINGNTLEYFIIKYGEDLGLEKYNDVCSRKGITLENMVRVHGQEKGETRYYAWLEKHNKMFTSLIANEFITFLVPLLPKNIKFYDGVFSREYCIYYSNRAYLYDFVITRPTKLAIEFNGDFWHADPAVYNPDDVVNLPQREAEIVLAKDIWKKDEQKLQCLRDKGFEILLVWEKEYRADKEGIINKAYQWILQNLELKKLNN